MVKAPLWEPYGTLRRFTLRKVDTQTYREVEVGGLKGTVLCDPDGIFDHVGEVKTEERESRLTAYLRGIEEEGYTGPNWFIVDLHYPNSLGGVKVGGDYHRAFGLGRGSDSFQGTQQAFLEWCRKNDWEITSERTSKNARRRIATTEFP